MTLGLFKNASQIARTHAILHVQIVATRAIYMNEYIYARAPTIIARRRIGRRSSLFLVVRDYPFCLFILFI